MVGTARADEDGPKGKGEKPNIIQLDLNKLPPDLAKALQKFAESSKPTPPAKEKEKYEGKSPFTATNPPPGLTSESSLSPQWRWPK